MAIQVIKDEVNKLKDELEAKENGILGLQIKLRSCERHSAYTSLTLIKDSA